MQSMILISLAVNVIVLLPVCAGLFANASWAVEVYGNSTPARGILLSIYASILCVSLWLLVHRNPTMVAPLLLVQVTYKFTTPFTVGNFKNPVVISNLAIAILHLATLYMINQEAAF